jgi:hypothetical protein
LGPPQSLCNLMCCEFRSPLAASVSLNGAVGARQRGLGIGCGVIGDNSRGSGAAHSSAVSAADSGLSTRQRTCLLGCNGLLNRSGRLAMARGRRLSAICGAKGYFEHPGCLLNVIAASHIVIAPPIGHTADEKVRYCRIGRRGGCLLILQQNQYPQHCPRRPRVTAWSAALSTREGCRLRCTEIRYGRAVGSWIGAAAVGAGFAVDRTA